MINNLTSTQKAMQLAERGFKVFPLNKNKKPIFTEFYKKASANPKMVEVMFQSKYEFGTGAIDWKKKDQGYLIGISTDNLIVVDIDNKHGHDGNGNFFKLTDNYLYTNTMCVGTPSDGFHLYFRKEDVDYKNSISLLADGIDTRGFHGFVVAPGSVTEKGDYEEMTETKYTVDTLPKCPQVILDILNKKIVQDSDRVKNVNNNFEGLDSDSSIVKATEYLMHADGCDEGEQSNVAFKVACKLREFGLSEDTCHTMMCEEWDYKNNPSMADWMDKPVSSAYRYASNPIGSDSVENDFYDLDSVSFDSEAENNSDDDFGDIDMSGLDNDFEDMPVIANDIKVPSFEEFMASKKEQEKEAPKSAWAFGNIKPIKDIPKRPWLIENLLLSGALTTLSSAGGTGKTTAELEIAIGLANGAKEILGFKNAHEGKAIGSLLFSAEDSLDELSRRSHAVCIEHGYDPEKTFKHIALLSGLEKKMVFGGMGSDNKFEINKDTLNFVYETYNSGIEQGVNIGFIAFDPLANLHECSENDSVSMTHIMSIFNKIASDTGCAVLLTHHTSKASDGSVSGARGSSSIVNSSRISLVLNSMSKEEAKALGMEEEDAPRISYISEGKSNVSEKTGKTRYYYMKSVEIGNGDSCGVHTILDIEEKKLERYNHIIDDVEGFITRKNEDSVSLKVIVDQLKNTIATDICGKKSSADVIAFFREILIKTFTVKLEIDEDNGLVVRTYSDMFGN